MCKPCWRRADSLCIECGAASAQWASIYQHACKACMGKRSVDAQYELVREESVAYLERVSAQQQWAGKEAALQILVLPMRTGKALPTYSDSPEYLSPSHCRLCFQVVEGYAFPQHLLEKHGLTEMQYRAQVLSRTVAEWPQPISPQTLRSRLAAFK